MIILIATLGSYGDINPYLALGKSLASHGHSVAIATSDKYRSDIVRHRLGYFPMRPHTVLSREDFRKLMDPRKGSRYVVNEYLMPHLQSSYEDLEAAAKNADILVSHDHLRSSGSGGEATDFVGFQRASARGLFLCI